MRATRRKLTRIEYYYHKMLRHPAIPAPSEAKQASDEIKTNCF